MNATDPELRAHREWLGYVQPVGLLVSAPALAANQAFVNRNVQREQQVLSSMLEAGAPRFERIATELLGWERTDLIGAAGNAPIPAELEVALPEYGEHLVPTLAIPNPDSSADSSASERYLLLIKELAPGTAFDEPEAGSEHAWHASPQARFERLLRETSVPQGLIVNGAAVRVVYAPSGESSGYATFELAQLVRPDGRLLVSALCMLLNAARLFTVPTKQRLPALLRESRRYQNQVSNELAEQVLEALLELLRGFATADAASQGRLLADVLASKPDDIYGGLLATLMRLVFLLYAEERGLLPQDPVFVQHYSLIGLFEKLRDDAGRSPDTMDQRYGAWARLLALFRLIYEGAGHGELQLPARHGRLFDPDAYPFLEGRTPSSRWREVAEVVPPRVPDGVILRVLEKLLVLDGERLSYRALDVEQIGSVYEAMMGFQLERARGASIAVRPDHVVVDLDGVLATKPTERAKRLADEAGCKLTAAAAKELAAARSVDALVAALGRRVSPHTPSVLPTGALFLQPTEERRRSGAHYTPRTLTQPIVRTTLEPVLAALGAKPRADAILELRLCDPAMGSGAFLVEACRFLAARVVEAWTVHGDLPPIPPDEDPQLFAQRRVAQRCLYGVDRNPFAVDLAKLSLWLATLAKDHPFTFLDHALRCGDSLVGLSREQVVSFNWKPAEQAPTLRQVVEERLRAAEALRRSIHALADADATDEKIKFLSESDAAVDDVRVVGDLAVAAFFSAAKDRAREDERKRVETSVQLWLGGKLGLEPLARIRASLRSGDRPVVPFHWHIEFPEVFGQERPGFDAFLGNPPFLGGTRISTALGDLYLAWLRATFPESGDRMDLVAYFFRRAFSLLRKHGTLGLIATKTIAQGDTRESGLRWIANHGGTIYAARKRIRWPGQAAVVVSVVHVANGEGPAHRTLDGRVVDQISAFLFHRGGHESPSAIVANKGKCFEGYKPAGRGFVFDDEDEQATPISEMRRLISVNPRNGERIFPYIGGEEVNEHPTQSPTRYIINFGELSESEARAWPDLVRIIEEKVRPYRESVKRSAHRERWWRYGETRPGLTASIQGLDRVLAISQTSKYLAVAFLSTEFIFSHKLVVFPLGSMSAFSALQSSLHEVWVSFFGSTLGETHVYTASDCFDTFPFSENWERDTALEAPGREYYEFRAAVMSRNNEGLTKTYNRFHDPDEQSQDIARLRSLHASLDRAVLDAYGWDDLRPEPKFLIEDEADFGDEEWADRHRKPWRYRWTDDVRDEVLARLLALNRERSEAEQLAGAAADKPALPKTAKRSRKLRGGGSSPLFD
jgi:hypothetical protein